MIDIELIRDNIVRCIGLMDALHESLWALPVPIRHKKTFNSALAVSDCLCTELNNTYNLIRDEV